MTKEKLLDNLKWSMKNQTIDLEWVQRDILTFHSPHPITVNCIDISDFKELEK